jgi:MFS family permease
LCYLFLVFLETISKKSSRYALGAKCSQVLFGWAADRPWLNVAKTYTVCLLGTGLFVVAMPLVSDHLGGLIVVGAGFGAFFASTYSFTPPLLVELVPLDRFTTAYGLSLLCQGIGNLLGPPLAGQFLYNLLYPFIFPIETIITKYFGERSAKNPMP